MPKSFLDDTGFQAEVFKLQLSERMAMGKTMRDVKFRGLSMLPMLRQYKDSVELAPLPEKLHKYDLPVYRLPSGKYVMHRVVAVRDDHYVCLGDNTYVLETVKPEQLVAFVRAFSRNGRQISVDAPMYKLYCRAWVAIYPARKLARRAYLALKRVLRNAIRK